LYHASDSARELAQPAADLDLDALDRLRAERRLERLERGDPSA
jgi:hypothetical protein